MKLTNFIPNPDDVQSLPDNIALYTSLLHEMMRVGIGLIRTLEYASTNTVMDGRHPPPDTALSFERYSRAIRRSMMLAVEFAESPHATRPPEPQAEPPGRTEPNPEPPENPIQAGDANDPGDAPELPDDAQAHDSCDHEPRESFRADREEPDDALDHLPIPVRIAAIRRDLGLDPIPLDPPTPAQPATTPYPESPPTTPKPQTNPTPAQPHARKPDARKPKA